MTSFIILVQLRLLKLHIHGNFYGSGEFLPLNMVVRRADPPKVTSLRDYSGFEPLCVKTHRRAREVSASFVA